VVFVVCGGVVGVVGVGGGVGAVRGVGGVCCLVVGVGWCVGFDAYAVAAKMTQVGEIDAEAPKERRVALR
jgi:hypothetical protein